MSYLPRTPFDPTAPVYDVEVGEHGPVVFSECCSEGMSLGTARLLHHALGRWIADCDGTPDPDSIRCSCGQTGELLSAHAGYHMHLPPGTSPGSVRTAPDTTAETRSDTADSCPDVQGRCPACRGTSLFLGSGGYVTCRRLHCPNPCAADELLHGTDSRPDDGARPFADLRSAGLLWLINRVALHPRGLALALRVGNDGTPYGWSLLAAQEAEPWTFDPETDADGFTRAEATLSAALGGPRRLGHHHTQPRPEELAVTELAELRARVENAEGRLRLARDALADDGYFTADQIGPDLAPRLTEWLTHHGERTETAEATIDRVRAIHHQAYGLCNECTGSHAAPWPCPTINALDEHQEQ